MATVVLSLSHYLRDNVYGSTSSYQPLYKDYMSPASNLFSFYNFSLAPHVDGGSVMFLETLTSGHKNRWPCSGRK